jgi:hypothetical protein
MSDSVSYSFFSRRMAFVLFLGFCSGLPLALTGGTLQAWMKDEGIDLATMSHYIQRQVAGNWVCFRTRVHRLRAYLDLARSEVASSTALVARRCSDRTRRTEWASAAVADEAVFLKG